MDHAADARGGQGRLGARHLRHVVGRAQPARVMPRRWHGGYTCRGPSATGEDIVAALRCAPVRPYPRPWRRSSCMLIDAAAEHATVAGSAARSRAFPTTPPPALSLPRPRAFPTTPARALSFISPIPLASERSVSVTMVAFLSYARSVMMRATHTTRTRAPRHFVLIVVCESLARRAHGRGRRSPSRCLAPRRVRAARPFVRGGVRGVVCAHVLPCADTCATRDTC